jgi:hypothetical protein
VRFSAAVPQAASFVQPVTKAVETVSGALPSRRYGGKTPQGVAGERIEYRKLRK